MAVAIETAPALNVGTPHELFEGSYFNSGHDWAITPDGSNFIFIRDKEGQSGPGEMNVVLNWFEELKRRAPQTTTGTARFGIFGIPRGPSPLPHEQPG
jgi:hypothetical protein